ncbi:toxin VasX [Aeromonas finlandensis]|uniref:toxin VasX n=1 Tax=Aeromonas finlandensis TaxID=1543375 RepID=UPI00051C1500|nr:toxin VasX [Aeromonas finlandensis]
MGQQNQAKGGPNQVAIATSNKDCKSPVGTCPFKNKEIALVPVRYALDEVFEEPAKQPHPLPAKHFKGPLALKANPYTLRQLRDGWLYLFDETAKELDEYEVRGSQFIHASKGSKGHLLYPANHKVAIAFSHQRWTERLKKEYRKESSLRSKGMRSFNLLSLARKMGGEHAGLLDLLSTHVADMGLPNEGFINSCAPLKAPAGVESGKLWHDKPAGSPEASKAGIADLKSALVVALDDHISDMHDVAERLSDILLRYEHPFNDDDTRHRWNMAGITEMLALPQLDESSLPVSVRGDRLATFKLKKQLQSYLVAKHDYKDRQGSGNHYIDLGAEQSLMAQHAALKQWGLNPDKWASWPGVRFDDEVNWSGLEGMIQQYAQGVDALRPRWLATYDDALQLLQALPTSPLLLGLDSQTEDTQTLLLASSSQWIFSLFFAPDTKRGEQLTKALKKGALPALAHYGFDIEVKKELENNPGWIGVGNITGVANMLAAMEAIASNHLLSDSKLLGGLHEGAKATMRALKGAIAGVAIKPWQQLSELLHPHLLSGEKLGRTLSLVVLESIHTGQQVRINSAFVAESKAFVAQVQGNLLGKLATPGVNITEGHLGRMKAAGAEWSQLEWPRLFVQEGGLQEEFERKMTSYLNLQRQGAKGAQAAAKVWQEWGNFGGLAALLNIANLTVALQGYDENSSKLQGNPAAQLELSRNLAYTAAWTGSAMVAIKQGQVVVPEHLLEKRLALAMKENPALVRRFALTTGWMTGLGLLAAGLEAWETGIKLLDDTNADMEKVGYGLKLGGVGVQGFAMGRSLMLLGRGASLGAIWAPWMVATIGIGSLLYLVATVILARYSRLPVERWLLHSTWGTKPAGWPAAEELIQYERVACQPTVELKEGKLTVALPPHLRTITLQLSIKRLGYQLAKQSYPASALTPVLGPAQEAAIKVTSQGAGQVTLAVAANQGDELQLQIGYPAAESLSGQPLRFMARGTLAKGVVLTAEIDDKLPTQGTLIELK